MSSPYNAERVALQRLLALCKRNLARLDVRDQEIVEIMDAQHYEAVGDKGQKRRSA